MKTAKACLAEKPPLVFTAEELETALEIRCGSVRNYECPGMGVPGDWFLNRHSVVCYTPIGVAKIVVFLRTNGLLVLADKLSTFLEKAIMEYSASHPEPVLPWYFRY